MKGLILFASILISASSHAQGAMPVCAASATMAAQESAQQEFPNFRFETKGLILVSRDKNFVDWKITVMNQSVGELNYEIIADRVSCNIISVDRLRASEPEEDKTQDRSSRSPYPGVCCHPGRPSKCC